MCFTYMLLCDKQDETATQFAGKNSLSCQFDQKNKQLPDPHRRGKSTQNENTIGKFRSITLRSSNTTINDTARNPKTLR